MLGCGSSGDGLVDTRHRLGSFHFFLFFSLVSMTLGGYSFLVFEGAYYFLDFLNFEIFFLFTLFINDSA